jgi:transcriptional regulator with XRE-family HTH domain
MRKSVHSSAAVAFRKLLIEARNKADLTQQEVAERLKKPQSFVAKYERGERRIDLIEFVAIARALEADPVQLLRAFLRRTAA